MRGRRGGHQTVTVICRSEEDRDRVRGELEGKGYKVEVSRA